MTIFVGAPVHRVEDKRLLTGTGTFIDDMTAPGLLHAVILRSSIPHGNIRAIDTSRALAMPGVHAVITAADVGEEIPRIPLRLAPMPTYQHFLQPVIAHDKVRYVGEPVAVVVAESPALAEDALEGVLLDIEILPPIADYDAAVKGETLLFEPAGENIATSYLASRGDCDAAFAKADYVRRERFGAHRHTALPMETRGQMAEWKAATGRMVISGASKVAFFNRRTLAPMLSLAETDIEMIEVDIGGEFGVKGEFYPEDFLIPFAARHVGRPVKWIEDRREHLMATNHSREMDCELEIACTRDGVLLGMRGKIFADMGAYIRTNGGVVPAKAAQFLPGPYRFDNVAIVVEAAVTNKTPCGTYRAPGRFEANFFRERLLDMIAKDLGLDRVEFRRRNLVTEAELPYDLGKLVPYEPQSALDTGDYHAAFDRALKEIRWSERIGEEGRLIDGRYRGLSITPFMESSGSGREFAKAVIESDGSVTIHVGSSVLGQGLETTLTQVAADQLRLPMERVRILHGSTTHLANGFGTYASRGMVVGGGAVQATCDNLLAAIREQAAARLGFPNAEIEIANGRVKAGDRADLALVDFAGLAVDGEFSTDDRSYSYGTHACYVAVDPRTGHTEILDYMAIEDIGRAINPHIVHGQAIGALVQGLGGTFLDHLVYDEDAQLVSGSLADYLVPLATDFPNIRAITLELRLSKNNPLGAKGAGEGGMVSVAAAVGSAIAAALAPLGVEPNRLPLSPPRIWAMIEAARAGQRRLCQICSR